MYAGVNYFSGINIHQSEKKNHSRKNSLECPKINARNNVLDLCHVFVCTSKLYTKRGPALEISFMISDC